MREGVGNSSFVVLPLTGREGQTVYLVFPLMHEGAGLGKWILFLLSIE